MTYRAGYVDLTGSPTGSVASVPARYKAAIKLVAEAHFYGGPDMSKLFDAARSVIGSDCAELSMA